MLADARPTNYGVVRLELIEDLYERMYHQRRELGTDETKWPHRIIGGHRVVRVESKEADVLRLFVEPDENIANDSGKHTELQDGDSTKTEAFDVDLIVAATGYQRNTHVNMLKGVWPLLPEKSAGKAADDTDIGIGTWQVEDTTTTHGSTAKVLAVARDYHVGFAPGRVTNGSGIWLQGCCEGSHGVRHPVPYAFGLLYLLL